MTPGYLSGPSWIKMNWMCQHVPTCATNGRNSWYLNLMLRNLANIWNWSRLKCQPGHLLVPDHPSSVTKFRHRKKLTLSAWNIAVHMKFISVLLQVDCEVGTYIYNNIQQHTTAIWKQNLRQFVVACHISAIICTSLGGWGCPIPGDAQTLAGRKYM
jgi:hypothetical protein